MSDHETTFIRKFREHRVTFADFRTASPALLATLAAAQKLANSDITMTIHGPRGVGKSYLAEAIHNASPRKGAIFIPENLLRVPKDLLMSRLCGHKKGSFTGASSDQIGLIEAADGGTLFLDEGMEITGDVQICLLDILDSGRYTPLGETKPKYANVRFLFGTNRRLEELRANPDRWRPDFLDRTLLNCYRLPGLDERICDIPDLVKRRVKEVCRRQKIFLPSVPDATLAAIAQRPCPGNLRELDQCLEAALVLHRPQVLLAEHLPKPQATTGSAPLVKPLDVHIMEYCRDVVAACGGNKSEAARLLCIARNTLQAHLGEKKEGEPAA